MMFEKIEMIGHWWLPERKNDDLSGILRCDEAGNTTLELIGSFVDVSQIQDFSPEIILGVCSGKPITLYKCRLLHFKGNASAVTSGSLHTFSSTMEARATFIGAHFEDASRVRFPRIEANYPNLYEWIAKTGFQSTGFDENAIKYGDVEPTSCNIGNGITLRIGTVSHTSLIGSDRSIKESSYVQAFTDGDRKFEDIIEILSKFEDFLALATSSPTSPYYVKCYISPENDVECVQRRIVDIYYPLGRVEQTIKPFSPEDCLFFLPQIEASLSIILYNWYFKEFRLQPGYDLYFGTLQNPRSYDYNVFLNFMQSIESYHRLNYGGSYTTLEEYSKLSKLLSASTPEEHYEWLNGKLRYGNEKNLRSRLKMLIKRHMNILKEYIDDELTFIDQAVLTRNYLTHYDDDLEEVAQKGEGLGVLILRVRLLLEVIILWEIGFSEDMIKTATSRQRRYRRLRSPRSG